MFSDSGGSVVTLAARLGAGGEGTTFEAGSGRVAKVLAPRSRTAEKRTKLESMIENPPETRQAGRTVIAWPAGLLFENRRFAGYLMPRVNGAILADLLIPGERSRRFPGADLCFVVHAASNLARLFAAIHAQEYVIGDVKSANFLVDESAIVSAVDTDSFQVRDHAGALHRCAALTPEYRPPEAEWPAFADSELTPSHDLFGLWVLVFELLMAGNHPFRGGIENRPTDSIPRTEAGNIRAGLSPYFANGHLAPRPDAPVVDYLDAGLFALFTRAFEEGHRAPERRPSALEWVEALDEAGQSLERCRKDKTHWYWPESRRACIWCDIGPARRPVARPTPRPAALVSPVPPQRPWRGGAPRAPRRSRAALVLTLAATAGLGLWSRPGGSGADFLAGLVLALPARVRPAPPPAELPVCADASDIDLSGFDRPTAQVVMRPGCWSGLIRMPQEQVFWRVDTGRRSHELMYPDGSKFAAPAGHHPGGLPPSAAFRLRGDGIASVSLYPKDVGEIRAGLKAGTSVEPPFRPGKFETPFPRTFDLSRSGTLSIEITRLESGWLMGASRLEGEPGLCGRLYEVSRTEREVIFWSRGCEPRYLRVRPDGDDDLEVTWGYSPEPSIFFDRKARATRTSPRRDEERSAKAESTEDAGAAGSDQL